MNVQTRDPGGTGTTSRKRECLTCDIPPFCRSNYYTGKLLTERDLTDEQRYLVDKLRLHYVALHGWGVVCGLKVQPHKYCPQLRLVIEEGLAIDDCGREIRLMRDVEVELPKPVPRSHDEEPCPPEPSDQDQEHQQEGHRYDDHDRDENDEHERYPDEGGSGHGHPPEEEKTTLYVCLRYAECETEFTPAPFDECACNENSQKANRICETWQIDLLTDEPEWLHHIHKHKGCGEGDCWELYRTTLGPCPKPGQVPCILLAVISDYVPGQPVTEDMIDNWKLRPVLPNTHLLDQLIRCILEKLPTKTLTRIVEIAWNHGEEYHCHDFMRFFVDAPAGLEIKFENEVRPDGINTRSFQALVVRPPDEHQGRHMEIAPARVTRSGQSCSLHIDPAYARRRLDGHAFDLFITLKCDVISDINGNPVDGNFLARLQDDGTYSVNPPTGDGIPGGLFESWIRVRNTR